MILCLGQEGITWTMLPVSRFEWASLGLSPSKTDFCQPTLFSVIIVRARFMPKVGNLARIMGFIEGKEDDVPLMTEEH